MRPKILSLLAVAFNLGVVQAASAADMPVKAPAAAVLPSWTGYYAGLNIGYGGGDDPFSMSTVSGAGYPILGPGVPLYTTYGNPFTTKIPIAGVNGGGQIGYNYQFDPMWVAGVEADIQAAGMNGNVSCLLACGTRLIIVSPPLATSTARVNFSDISAGNKIKWFGTLRGRVGLTGDKNWAWLYLTGGLAYGEVERSGSVAGTSTSTGGGTIYNTFAGAYDNSSVRVGWTVGAGVEGKLMGNWSVKTEYLYVDLGSATDTFNTIYLPGSAIGTPGTVAGVRTDVSKFHEHIVRLGLNYKFGG